MCQRIPIQHKRLLTRWLKCHKANYFYMCSYNPSFSGLKNLSFVESIFNGFSWLKSETQFSLCFNWCHLDDKLRKFYNVNDFLIDKLTK